MSTESTAAAHDEVDLTSPIQARVLVVDDEADLRNSMAEILRSQGFTVAEAADGAAATWLIADQEFDVIVLDLHLCRVDGTAVLEALEPAAPVVIVSAFSYFDEDAIREEFDATIFACLHKPVPPPRLIEIVSAAAMADRVSRVRPIAPRDAIRLGFAGLARIGPADSEA